jgi:predicted phosphodiesterase
VDQVVCLGDVAWGPQPRQTVERLRVLGYPTVMGNTDEELLDVPADPAVDDNARMIREIARWCAAQLSDADREYLRTFRPTVEIPLGDERTLLCFHGSPRSFHDRIVDTTPEVELMPMLAGHSATVLAGGHTHQQLLRRYRESILVNPGSVGLPFERAAGEGDQARNPPWAEYAVVSVECGALGVELRRVPLDLAAVMAAIRASGMPYAKEFARDWR